MFSWICFEWELSSLDLPVPSTAPLVIRAAQPGEKEIVLKVLLSAFSMDSSWGDISRRLQEGIGCFVDRAFEKGAPSCIVALHGQRIIGASLLDANTEATNHLLSGPMILHEYRNRGLGSGMLATSLTFLKDKGVSKALGVTRGNSISARFIYTKFSSTQSPFTLDPLQVSAR